MQPAELIRDPVFQLNLLLWMAKEQPARFPVVRPLFFENGFEIQRIEQPFPLPQETLIAAEQSGLEISVAPEPELVLARSADRIALYFEAKANSFSSTSAGAKQARGHLLATGPAFAEVLAPLRACLLCYVVPEEARQLMIVCLQELTEELPTKGLVGGLHSCHGMAVVIQELHYTWDVAFQSHVGVAGMSAVVMTGITDDTDPTPLFLIYTDEDYPDADHRDLLRRCMVNQVHALLVCELNQLSANQPFEKDVQAVLAELTDGTFQYLGRKRQKSMRRLVKENVLWRIRDYCKSRFPGVDVTGETLRVVFDDESARSAFLDWFEDLRRTAFPAHKTTEEKTPLFDGIDEGIP